MTESTHPVDALVDATYESLDLDAHVRDALLERRLLAEQSRRVRSDQPRALRRRIPRARLTGVGAALVGSAVLIMVIAFGPDSAPTSRTHLPSPDSAQAALLQAGSAAATADWTPLGPDEFHHTMTTSFTPDIPTRPGDPQAKIDQTFSFAAPMSKESWLGRDGRGLTLMAMGGNGDPDAFPEVFADGYGMSPTFGSSYPDREDVDVETSLRLADSVMVESLPAASGPATSASWYRSPSGYVRRTLRTGRGYVPPGTTTMGEGLQARHWGATMDRLDKINEASDAERDAAVATLLDEFVPGVSNNELWRLGDYGATRETITEDGRIVRAINLLGSAPLAPEVRGELYEWLAEHPLARLEGDTTDELGRPGTRVTFERIYDEVVPSHLVTLEDLRDQYERQSGKRPAGDVRGPKAVRVREDHQYRRWYVSVVFDRSTGELLEHVLYMRQETTAQRPRLQPNTVRGEGPQAPWRVAMGVDRQAMHDAVLYQVRARSTMIDQPATAACEVTPRMCRPHDRSDG